MQEVIENKLIDAFCPTHLEVVNESCKHKGHVGDDGSGESHFSVVIKSDKFKFISRLECHKMVIEILKSEISTAHSISILVKY